MSQITKVWLGIFLVMFFMMIAIGCITANIDINSAKDYKADVVANLENSNFNASVINSCISTAADNDYKLSIVTYDEDGNVNTYSDGNPAINTEGVYTANVTMQYKYTIKFLNVSSKRTLRGFAR